MRASVVLFLDRHYVRYNLRDASALKSLTRKSYSAADWEGTFLIAPWTVATPSGAVHDLA